MSSKDKSTCPVMYLGQHLCRSPMRWTCLK